MTNYILDGYDLKSLFETNIQAISFKEDPKHHIPEYGSIMYSIWNKDEQFIYIGVAGTQTNGEKKPRSRIKAHRSGKRSGDQFCVYVHDYYVIPSLLDKGIYEPIRGALDQLTKEYIHNNFSYRFKLFEKGISSIQIKSLENQIKKGIFGKPFLNGT